jgi:hypothetical protein
MDAHKEAPLEGNTPVQVGNCSGTMFGIFWSETWKNPYKELTL